MIFSESFFKGKSENISFLFSVFSVFTVLTELRFVNLPFGVGELGLIFFGVFFIVNLKLDIFKVFIKYKALTYFWLTYFGAVFIGGILSYYKNRLSLGWVHDLLAVFFVASYTFLFLLVIDYLNGYYKIVKNFIFFVFFVASLAFVFLILAMFGFKDLSVLLNVNQWFEGVRMNGWSNDPNQWAFMLMLATYSFVASHVLKESINKNTYFMLFLIFILCLLPRSDAVLFSLLFVLSTLIVFSYYFEKNNRFFLVKAIIILFFVFSMINITNHFLLDVPSSSQIPLGIGIGDDKVNVRLTLFINALLAWQESPVFGLGPGAYSGFITPFENTEAHNIVLQLLVNSGICGLLAATALLVWLFLRLKSDTLGCLLLIGVFMLIVHGAGHYMMRHPLFWSYIVIAVWEATARVEHKREAI